MVPVQEKIMCYLSSLQASTESNYNVESFFDETYENRNRVKKNLFNDCSSISGNEISLGCEKYQIKEIATINNVDFEKCNNQNYNYSNEYLVSPENRSSQKINTKELKSKSTEDEKMVISSFKRKNNLETSDSGTEVIFFLQIDISLHQVTIFYFVILADILHTKM